MIATELAPEVVVGAAYRLVILALVLVVAVAIRRKDHWPVWVLILFGFLSNGAFIVGNLSLSGLFAVPYIGLIGYVCVSYMRQDVTAMKALLAAKEQAWSLERHDLVNDKAAVEAELYSLRRSV